jgi:regulator of replication initiation timing
MMLGGARRKRARKAALKHEVHEVRTERETLAEENARLQAELEQERSVYPADGTVLPETAEGRGKHAR